MFRFTIRDVLWLTVVAALAVGWWVDRTQLKQRMDGLIPDPKIITIRKVPTSP